MYVVLAIVLPLFVAISILFWYRKEQEIERKNAIIALAITIIGTLSGVFFAVYMTNLTTEQSEKEHLSIIITLTVSENSAIVQEIQQQQKLLKAKPETAMANFEPYMQTAPLDRLSDNLLFTKYCAKEAKQLIVPLGTLRNVSYFAGLAVYTNTPAMHNKIDKYIADIEASNALLTQCQERIQ